MRFTQVENHSKFINHNSIVGNTTLLQNNDNANRDIKTGIWIYFLLLLFEGGLRKWVLPGLASPLLIIRDPVALWLIFLCFKRGLIRSNYYIFSMVLIGVISFFTAVFFGHGNIYVALFGLRVLVIHFPFMFVIGNVFTREDVVKMCKATVLIAIPMAVLIIMQFYSPQTAFVNKGIGDNVGGGFSGANGYFRPPATFSFTNGTTSFFGFAAALVFYFWLNPGRINKFILIVATLAVLLSVPFSISRTLFFEVLMALAFAFIASLRKPQYLKKMIITLAVGILVLLILSRLSILDTATAAFTARFTGANEYEGGVKSVLLDRYLGGIISALFNTETLPLLGYGLGYGSAFAGVLLTGQSGRSLGEGDWGRIIGELGPFIGFLVVFIRVAFSANIIIASVKKLNRQDMLPWSLLAFGILIIPQGEWAQPTALGFSTLAGGLILASINSSKVPGKFISSVPNIK
ncbi:MAG: hypothetical protein JWP44_3673 [Mucilaginibacter sp.]|nr:hypothetical protein [Mucilaginibacter sp.]